MPSRETIGSLAPPPAPAITRFGKDGENWGWLAQFNAKKTAMVMILLWLVGFVQYTRRATSIEIGHTISFADRYTKFVFVFWRSEF